MVARSAPPTPIGTDLRSWAFQMTDYIQAAVGDQLGNEPSPIQIPHLMSSRMQSAVHDGTLMFDPSLGTPVYSWEKDWIALSGLQTDETNFVNSSVYPLGNDAYMSVGQFAANDGRYGGMRAYDANGDKTGSAFSLDSVNPANTYIDCGLDGTIYFRNYDAANGGPYTTVAMIRDNALSVDMLNDMTGSQLVITAGEAGGAPEIATMTSEAVYIAAENGLRVYSSTDNLSSGLNNNAYICNADGESMLPNCLGVGTTPNSSVMLRARSGDESTGTYAMIAESASGDHMFSVRGDGSVRMLTTYDKTTGSAANMYISSSGWLYRSTSSGKYKDNYRELTDIYASLDLLNPIRFYSLTDKRDYIGFEAENVGEALPDAHYDDNYDVRSVVALNTAILKDMDARLRKLENDL